MSERQTGMGEATAEVAYLDGALWQRLLNAEDLDEFQSAWLTLQCSQITGVRRAVLVTRNSGPFRPVAFWPDRKATSRFVMELVEEALSRRVDQIRNTQEGGASGIARLIRQDGQIQAVLALELDTRSEPAMQAALRQLHWGAGWNEAFMRRDRGSTDRESIERLTLALDSIAIAGEHKGFRAAAMAALSELSVHLSAARISFGTRGRRGCRVRAVSNSTQFDRRVRAVRSVVEAMDEAVDQAMTVAAPHADSADIVNTKARALSEERSGGTVVTVPFARDGEPFGAFVFEWTGTEDAPLHLLEALEDIGALLGPVLADKLAEERWLLPRALDTAGAQIGRLIGPGYLRRKLILGTLAAIAVFFAFFQTEFRVTADARVRGQIERVIAAPLDGYIVEADMRAGDRVAAGDLLVRLDDVEFQLEKHSWTARMHQYETEYAQALAAFDRAGTNILRAQTREAEAQIELNETRIGLTRIRAPFDGLIVSGDLSQQLGRSIRQGEELFRITPLDDYRLRIEVDEGDVAYVEAGQVGSLVLSSLPDQNFDLEVERVTPVTGIGDGRNHFVVEARLKGSGDRPLRPGMEGIAKIETGQALLIWVWTRKLIDWARLTWWRWAP